MKKFYMIVLNKDNRPIVKTFTHIDETPDKLILEDKEGLRWSQISKDKATREKANWLFESPKEAITNSLEWEEYKLKCVTICEAKNEVREKRVDMCMQLRELLKEYGE